MKKNIIVGQSGGPTAVINSSLYALVKEGLNHPQEIENVFGMVNGVEGFLKGNVFNFNKDISNEQLECMKITPGAFLGSCRYKLPQDLSDEIYTQLFKKFEELNIGYFFYIGGNDSMDTVSKLSRFAKQIDSDIRFIGIPKTVDNDLVLTDHTPGYGSAARYVATTVREIVIDVSSYNNKSVTIIEIMGRHAGWLTAASALARREYGDNPLLIYLPESDFDEKIFLERLQDCFKEHTNIVVCVSEGIKDKNGTFICEYDSSTGVDAFGHKMLAGSGKYLENLVRKELNVKVRSIELNICQRCSGTMLSKTDQEESYLAGKYGLEGALSGHTGQMVALKREGDSPYILKYSLEDVNEICNKEKTVPTQWITKDGTDIDDAFIKYSSPLIQGVVDIPIGKDGLPKYAKR